MYQNNIQTMQMEPMPMARMTKIILTKILYNDVESSLVVAIYTSKSNQSSFAPSSEHLQHINI